MGTPSIQLSVGRQKAENYSARGKLLNSSSLAGQIIFFCYVSARYKSGVYIFIPRGFDLASKPGLPRSFFAAVAFHAVFIRSRGKAIFFSRLRKKLRGRPRFEASFRFSCQT